MTVRKKKIVLNKPSLTKIIVTKNVLQTHKDICLRSDYL
jgi:hypothetical protein